VNVPARWLAVTFLAAACICATPTYAQIRDGRVRGEVTDTSGGVLPGVIVVASLPDGRIVDKTVTDEVGHYSIGALPGGRIRLAFALDGFETGTITIDITPGSNSHVVERLKLARMTEEVVVYGKAPAPPLPRVPDPSPLPPAAPVPAEALESVCKPAKAGSGEFLGTIRAHRYDYGRTLYAKGDTLVVDGGTVNGLEVGRNLVVRRYYRANSRAAHLPEVGEHTAGLVQIVAADEHSSLAIVVHTCNELMKGDLLATFTPEIVRTPHAAGTPAYEDAARILFADDRQMVGAPRRLLVIDRGSDSGIEAGQRLTLFRRKEDGMAPLVLGEAVVVTARTGSATIRVVSATNAIDFGDWAAPQR
jgi:hypothetical protein